MYCQSYQAVRSKAYQDAIVTLNELPVEDWYDAFRRSSMIPSSLILDNLVAAVLMDYSMKGGTGALLSYRFINILYECNFVTKSSYDELIMHLQDLWRSSEPFQSAVAKQFMSISSQQKFQLTWQFFSKLLCQDHQYELDLAKSYKTFWASKLNQTSSLLLKQLWTKFCDLQNPLNLLGPVLFDSLNVKYREVSSVLPSPITIINPSNMSNLRSQPKPIVIHRLPQNVNSLVNPVKPAPRILQPPKQASLAAISTIQTKNDRQQSRQPPAYKPNEAKGAAAIALSDIIKNDQVNRQILHQLLKEFSTLDIFRKSEINLSYQYFGSRVSGFYDRDSDTDITLLTNSFVDELRLLSLLQGFFKVQYSKLDSIEITTELVKWARIPFLKVCLKQRRNPEKVHQLDFCVNNYLGIINSKFLQVYASIPWVSELGKHIKDWYRKTGLTGASQLPSYGLMLMMISFLIERKYLKCIIDDYQPIYFKHKRICNSQKEEVINPNISFTRDSKMAEITQNTRPSTSILFADFIRFYYPSDRFQSLKTFVVSVTNQKTPYVIHNTKEYVYKIIDPFDSNYNPGRIYNPKQVQKLKSAMKSSFPSLGII